MVGEALLDNRPLLGMVKKLGFDVHPAVGDGVAVLRLPLQESMQQTAQQPE
jgi:hypothetical protein